MEHDFNQILEGQRWGRGFGYVRTKKKVISCPKLKEPAAKSTLLSSWLIRKPTNHRADLNIDIFGGEGRSIIGQELTLAGISTNEKEIKGEDKCGTTCVLPETDV